ncbi:MAG: ferredoxin [Treponema sp.]|nr:ferredoxin [Treponema sp.]
MDICEIIAVYFSPAGKTKDVCLRIANACAHALQVPLYEDDFTLPATHAENTIRTYNSKSLVVFAVPTYAGRIPNKALPFVQTLFKGNGTKAVAVATFGNRSYDNVLAELCYELTKAQFCVVGAGAFVCKHSFANIGTARPNENDIEEQQQFGADVASLLQTQDETIFTNYLPVRDATKKIVTEYTAVEHYYTPLGVDGQPALFLKAKPITDVALCDGCMECVSRCPMGSIAKDNPANVPGICIKCHACVLCCTRHAKSFDDIAFLSHKKYLEQTYQQPAKNEVFLAAANSDSAL